MRLKIIVLIVVILSLQLTLSGCINENEDNNTIPDTKKGDLKLTISTTEETYPLGINNINISVELRNVATYTVKIFERYHFHTKIRITSPNNKTWDADYSRIYANMTYQPSKIKLEHNEMINFKMDIIELSPSNINWNVSGKYILQGDYDNIVNSNILEITIT